MPAVEEYALFIRGLASEVTGSNYTGGATAFTYNVSGSTNSASLTRSQSSGIFRIIGNPYTAPVNTSALTGQISNVLYYAYKISVIGSPTVKSGSWLAVPGSSSTTTLPVLDVRVIYHQVLLHLISQPVILIQPALYKLGYFHQKHLYRLWS